MFKIIVTNPNKIGSPFSATFETQELAQQWFEQCCSKPSRPFGLPEHQVELLDENGLSFDPPQYQTIPSEFEVEIEDISAQVSQKALNEESLAYLASTDWYVIRSLDGIPVPPEITAARQAARDRIVR